MSLLLCLLFIAGIVIDALQAAFLRFATTKQYFRAAVVSFLMTIVGYGVFYKILESLNHGDPHNLVAYALGGAIGSFLGLKYRQQP